MITTGSGKVNSKTREVGAKWEYPTFQDVTGTKRSRYGLQRLQRINCALHEETRLTLRSDIAVEWLAVLRFREVLSLIMDPEAGYSRYFRFSVGVSVPSADALILFYIAQNGLSTRTLP